MNKKFLRLVVLAVFVAVAVAVCAVTVSAAAPETAAPASAAPAAPAAKDPEKVLAKVEGFEIKEKDIDQVLTAAGPQAAMMYDNEQGRKAILDDLVAGRLFALAGKKQGLDNAPEFKSALDSFTNQTLARMSIENLIKDITVTDEECKKFYDGNLDKFTTQDEIRARHILLADDATSADKIALVQGELKKGVSFDVLAVEHSTDPSAAQGGGDLGFFSKGQMVPEFETAAFALKEPGDISEPIKSSFGWHIIKLEEKKPSTVMSYDEVKPQIEQYLSNEKKAQKYQEALDALKKEYKVEMPEPVSADVK